MTPEMKTPTFTDAEIKRELVNDSLGTVDQADTTDTDPKDDPARDKGIGTSENAWSGVGLHVLSGNASTAPNIPCKTLEKPL
jgi:hypothetical protein